jgi:hypothetical protein
MTKFSSNPSNATSYFDKLGMRLHKQTYLILSLSKDGVGGKR